MLYTPEIYISKVPDWATQIELVVQEPKAKEKIEPVKFSIETDCNLDFIVATISTPNGLFPPFLDATLILDNLSGLSYSLPDIPPNAEVFERPPLIIIKNPKLKDGWEISAESGSIPYAVTFMAFHPAYSAQSSPTPGPSGALPFKCRACKSTAKGLSLAILAAATLPTIPASLIAVVSSYLGVGAVIATAFITSVLGDTVDVIAEKLCKRVGLC